MLPSPTSPRFQPLRSGLINLFKYENQQFWYEHGRLLVRGNNGTGKSRVLALQLPFLLDAEIHPSRVEPDGDPARHIAWHLTMGEYPQRTGYTWIEFGRRDEKGVEHFVTLGCGMKATKDGDNQPTRWFFVTNRRVDLDFELVADSRPLSAEQLAVRIGEDCFPKNAREYRRVVDARLFSLGEERYRALMDLLIRLRAPQLAKKLDEKNLYAALSDSLPPLDADVVGKVAAAFRDLDDLRAQFESLTQLERMIGEFGEDYRRYAQVAIARRAAQLRTAHSTFERHQRDLAELNRKLTAARLAEESAELAAQGARAAALAAKSNHETLQESQAAGDAQALGLAASAAQSAERRAKATKEALAQAEAHLTKAEEELAASESAANEAESRLDHELLATLRTAQAAGFTQDHARLLPAQAADWPGITPALKSLRQSYFVAAQAHLRRLDAIDALLTAVAEATMRLAEAQRAETEASAKVSRLREIEQKHDTDARDAGKALALAYESWRVGLRWLAPELWSEFSEDFELWLDTGAEENRRLPLVLEKATSGEAGALATAREQLKTRTALLADRKAALQRERDELLIGPPPPPLAPATRDSASRAQRPGLALWQACEFAPHLTAAERAGLEAALEAAGLLDAWITPDGRLLADLPADTFLNVSEHDSPGSQRAKGATLVDWLHADLPETGAALSRAIVACALQMVAAGDAADSICWVALDGRWRIGPLTGRGQKESAKHLGARSREAARLARLQELEAALVTLANEESQLAHESDALVSREKAARTERSAAPSDDAVASALAQRSARRADLAQAREAFEAACRSSEAARTSLSTAIATRDRDATGLGFGEYLARLPELRGSWLQHESAMHALWSAADTRAIRKGLFGESQGRVAGFRETLALCTSQAEEANNEHISAYAAHEALRARVGATIEEFQRQLNSARVAREESEQVLKDAEAAIVKASKYTLELNTKLEPTKREMDAADKARGDASQHLRLPLHRGLFFEARPELGDIERDAWSATRAIEIARRIERELPDADLDDAGWTQLRNVLETRLTELRNRAGPLGCQARSEVVGQDLSIVVCAYQGVDHTPSSLRSAVATELAERERLLSEKERGIIETHLVSEVSARLQSLIGNARDRKEKMNAEMTRCATTLGVTLRLVWEPLDDASVPAGLRPVLKLILADHGTWTDPERAQVGAFLHQLIKDERQRDAAATWSEQLSRALDYRRWHAFGAERRQNGQWERLTRQRYGTGSGGEKALMLTIPQMAAAASHYRSAAPHSPRLILLDEAFAGMDKPTRAKCMGLLDKEAFDLDLLMTSEREWGAHDTVSGIAIYQLVADAQAIDATRWVWNGRKKRLAPVPDTPELRAAHPLPKLDAASTSTQTPPPDELSLG